MKSYAPILMLAATVAVSSCSTYSEWTRGTTGAYVGSMFGSLIGDIVGGPHGSTVGALVGAAAGGAAGVASAKAEQERREQRIADRYDERYDESISYGHGHDYSYIGPTSPASCLEVSNIVFADANNNRCLEGGETAYITFNITNRSGRPIYNVAPVITCENRRVEISPTATIARIDPARGMRYKAVVHAPRNVRSGQTYFRISFADNSGRCELAKSFQIYVRR